MNWLLKVKYAIIAASIENKANILVAIALIHVARIIHKKRQCINQDIVL